MKKLDEATTLLSAHLRELGLSFVTEYQFHPTRKWRFDFAGSMTHKDFKLAIEIEGAHWIQGRHNRGSGFEKDIEKYNSATVLGFAILRFTTKMVLDGTAKATIKEWLEARKKS
jgi:very-short-patch-repair endonuclease